MTAVPIAPEPSTATTTEADRHHPVPTVLVVVGWLALIAIGLGVVVSLIPVHNGGTQACGAPGAFLLEGRANVYPDADGRVQRSDGEVEQLSPDDVNAAYDRPCSKRVADRMVPAGALLAGGALAGLVSVSAAAVGALRRRRRPPP